MEENIKLEIIAKTILLTILTIVISIVSIFFIGITRVDATTQQRHRNTSNQFTNWTNITQDTTYSNISQAIGTDWATGWQFRDSTTMTGTNKYDYFISGTIEIKQLGDRVINFGIQTELYNGTNLVGMPEKCTVSQSQTKKNSTIGTIKYTSKKLTFSINCSGFSGNGYYPLITILYKSDVASTNVVSELYISKFNYVQTTSNVDSSAIINNQNNNTQAIINNNNANTEEITNAMEEFWNNVHNAVGWEEQDPDETAEDDMEDAEGELHDYLIDDSDLSALNYEVDVTSNQTIWDIFNRIYTGNQTLFTSLITILFIGIVKLILAR